MPDTNVADNQTENKNPKLASIGSPERVNFTPKISSEENTDGNASTPKGDAKNDVGETAKGEPAKIVDEAAVKEWFKSKGIEYEGEEKLKEKLTAKNTPTNTEPTEEQKLEQVKAKEKRRLDKWIAGGGTVENYVGIKNVADADVKELSINATKKELKDAKFSDEEIEKILRERYFQFDDDEIEQEENESDKDFKKRLKDYGTNKLVNRSSHTKKSAQDILAKLDKEIESEDLDLQEELQISANIDDKFKAVNRKYVYEIGEVNGKPILPIEDEVSESEITEVHETLKNPDKRNNFLFNTDGSLNYNNIADVLIENKKLKSALKVSYHEGSTRTNEHWLKMFPHETAYAIGVGGNVTNNKNSNGKATSFGKPQKTKLSTT